MSRAPTRAHLLAQAVDGLPARAAWAPWGSPVVVDKVDSTMTWLRDRAGTGAAEGSAIVADEQTSGRGRHGRSWQSPPGCGVQASVLLRPQDRPLEALGTLPLAIGVTIADRLADSSGVAVAVKWPNDVVVEQRPGGVAKLAGVLAERLPDGAVIVGVGLNVTTPREDLPEGATSLAIEGSRLTREAAALDVLEAIAVAYRTWAADAVDLEHYRRRCVTIGRRVSVREVDAGPAWEGMAVDIDGSGRLLVRRGTDDVVAVSAGDVTLATDPV